MLDTRGFEVPRYLQQHLCTCKGLVNFVFDPDKRVSVCKVERKYPQHLLRNCKGCGTVFFKNFSHPLSCPDTPLCWDCLHDPLCDDLANKCSGCAIDHRSVITRPPSFTIKKPLPWNGVSVFTPLK